MDLNNLNLKNKVFLLTVFLFALILTTSGTVYAQSNRNRATAPPRQRRLTGQAQAEEGKA